MSPTMQRETRRNQQSRPRWSSDHDLKALRPLQYYKLEDEPTRFMRWAQRWSRLLFAAGFFFWLGVAVGRGNF